MWNDTAFFRGLIVGWFALAVVAFALLFFVSAPYGRHSRKGWGATVRPRTGWIIMEALSPLLFGLCFVSGGRMDSAVAWVFLILWEAHYIHRAFIYPFRLRSRNREMPLAVVSMGIFFNGVNAYLNGRYLFMFSDVYPESWLLDLRFIAGALLFIAGYVVNRHADEVLRRLRGPGEKGYRIPYGGLYRWVSCPNYLGEIMTWAGWALATWSLPGLAFAVWTVANLAPRARSHHRWYIEQFPNYPPARKALLPGIW